MAAWAGLPSKKHELPVKDGFIFWEHDVRLVGRSKPDAAAARLEGMLSGGRFSFSERLVGAVVAPSVRVWRKAPIGTGDIVEFEGMIKPHGNGSVIEGTMRYKLSTKIQFSGCLAVGVLVTVAGLVQKLTDTAASTDIAGVGVIVSLVALIWIYTSSKMKKEQIRFIEDKLSEVIAS